MKKCKNEGKSVIVIGGQGNSWDPWNGTTWNHIQTREGDQTRWVSEKVSREKPVPETEVTGARR